ncbi:hypothetical protein PTTG_29923 [Puccinia triticina 1-1 BBBD Race 1]|uniref:Chromo domain-containing protein n=1 Tax=Puccinia triticina (isolate 1-1 / race 1 (BBBD)) TaxID=630390 RepID=A0A180G1V2_PUCT1|nr:hypothetical protein PTTG_29923 [Puccinia triticina 1-1 BBBD Race 1]
MKSKFNRRVRDTLEWKSGGEIWLDGHNISTTRPSTKLEHHWLGPFPIASQISKSTYKLTLPPSMQGFHLVFRISVLCKHKLDEVAEQRRRTLEPVIVDGGEELEVVEVLNCWRRGRTLQYLVSWKGIGPEEKLWEPAENLTNCGDLLADFNIKFPEAAAKHQQTWKKKTDHNNPPTSWVSRKMQQ